MKDDEIIEEARELYEEAEDAWSEVRHNAAEDLRFSRLAQQWPEDLKEKRNREGRPALTINRLPAFIRQVVNDGRLSKPAITVSPVDSKADIDTAEKISGLIRQIESGKAQAAYDTGLEYAVNCGFGFWRVDIDYAHDYTFDLDIYIRKVANPLSVLWDAYSEESDGSDWKYAFLSEKLPKREFKARYPDAEYSSWDGEDDVTWLEQDSILVSEYWRREKNKKLVLLMSDGEVIEKDVYESEQNVDGQMVSVKDALDAQGIYVVRERSAEGYKVTQRIITGKEVLETTEWPGRFIPIVPCYGEDVNVEGKRVFRSMIRDAIDPQRMFNYWRTVSTELVALAPKAPWVGPEGFADGDPKWETANTKSHAYLEYRGPQPPQRQPFAGIPAGALQEAMNAGDDLKTITGIYDASLGAKSNEISGVAITARDRQSDVGTFHYLDNWARAIGYTGQIIVDLIPHVYTGPRIARILGPDGASEEVELNQPTGKDKSKIYDVRVGRYDVRVDTGPSYSTQREAAAKQMMDLVSAFPQAATVIGDLLVKNLDWPGADEIAKRLQVLLPDNIKQMDQMPDVPPEAQAMIAKMATQLKQSQQAIMALQGSLRDLQSEQGIKAKQMEADLAEARIKAATELEKVREQNSGKMDVARLQAAIDLILEKMGDAPKIQEIL